MTVLRAIIAILVVLTSSPCALHPDLETRLQVSQRMATRPEQPSYVKSETGAM